MAKIVTIHSFRRGVGRTGLAVNLATLLTRQGRRVAVIDADFQSPGVHMSFDLPDEESPYAFNDYLWGKCDILSTVQEITSKTGANARGKLFVLPASGKISEIMRSIHLPSNIDRYAAGLEKLEKELYLDMILVDAPAGLNENTLQAIAVSNTVVLMLHPDKHDFQGAAVTVDMIRRLQVPDIYLVLNNAPEALDVEDARRQLEEAYRCGGGLILKHSEEMMALSGPQPFVLRHPRHPLTARIGELAERLSA